MRDFQIFVRVIGKGSNPFGGGTLYFFIANNQLLILLFII